VAFKLYGMEFEPDEKPHRGRPALKEEPKYKTYKVRKILKSYKPKNGHYKPVTTRPLTDAERDIIKAKFLKWGGIIKEDATKRLKKVIPDVTIFQIVGAVNGLHKKVRTGVIQVKDPLKYQCAIEAKRQEWATWNSPKYKELKFKLQQQAWMNMVPAGINFSI
jgi:hypothetical protein